MVNPSDKSFGVRRKSTFHDPEKPMQGHGISPFGFQEVERPQWKVQIYGK
jgi:hypothetical protein